MERPRRGVGKMDTVQEPLNYRIEKCMVCGKEFNSTLPCGDRQFCPTCMDKHQKEHEELVKQHVAIKAKIAFEAGVRKLERRGHFPMRNIYEAVKAVEEMVNISPSSFKSAYEVLTAIILYNDGFQFKINHKIDKYLVDFYVPEEKIVLEVDGGLHDLKGARVKDGRRDIEIRGILGYDWEIVRLPAGFVEKNPTLIGGAMIEIANKQRALRAKNRGMLPENYSKSTKAYYASLSSYEKDKIFVNRFQG